VVDKAKEAGVIMVAGVVTCAYMLLIVLHALRDAVRRNRG